MVREATSPESDVRGEVKASEKRPRSAFDGLWPSTGERRKGRETRLPVWRFLASLQSRSQPVAEDRFWDRQGLLWCAIAFASGIAGHALLPDEPFWPLVAGLYLAFSLLLIFLQRQGALGKSVLLAFSVASGLTAATVRTAYVDAPRLAEPMSVSLTGTVLERQKGASGIRLVLQVKSVDDVLVSSLVFPRKVRIRVPSDSAGRVGDMVRVRGRLFPPAGPVSPGGYDFSFRAYYSQIGATGFSFGPAQPIETGEMPTPGVRFAAALQNLRTGLADRIRSAVPPGPEQDLIVALLVGDRSGIGEAQEQDLRAAGLAHILAISGLHMALFAGGTYAAMLLFLALFPPLVLRWPVHKFAAVGALTAATIYLLLSGAAVATQRSFLMIALVFLGVFTGRRGLTLRSVALAGLVLLLIAPERLFFPGFQMSFAAVICLVAVYDFWRERPAVFATKAAARPGLLPRGLLLIAKWSAGIFVTALVAGLATGIVGAYHFGRIAPYGVLGNMLGMPVFSLLVMPMGVLALVLMPFGLAALPLSVMAFGLTLLLKIAAFTAGLSEGAGALGNLGGPATLLLLSALFLVLLLPGWRRMAALGPMSAGLLFTYWAETPDIQIAASGTRIAARDAQGMLRVSYRPNSFAGELWLQREGVSQSAIKSRKMKSPQRRCDAQGCVVRAFAKPEEIGASRQEEEPLHISLPKSAGALMTDCRRADIIVTDLIVPDKCAAPVVIDHPARARRGAASIWLEGDNQLGEGAGDATAIAKERGAGRPRIKRIEYAITDPPRPWHRPGTVTRASVSKARRNADENR